MESRKHLGDLHSGHATLHVGDENKLMIIDSWQATSSYQDGIAIPKTRTEVRTPPQSSTMSRWIRTGPNWAPSDHLSKFKGAVDIFAFSSLLLIQQGSMVCTSLCRRCLWGRKPFSLCWCLLHSCIAPTFFTLVALSVHATCSVLAFFYCRILCIQTGSHRCLMHHEHLFKSPCML